MQQAKLERCRNQCCFFVDGNAVTETEYEKAKQLHPGSYPATGRLRNATLETIIGCRKAAATRPDKQ
jgi:hypothetical protein